MKLSAQRVEAITSVGFVGIGNMGQRMAANLAKAGYLLSLYNRTRAKAEALANKWVEEAAITVCTSPAEVATRSQVVLTMVSDCQALQDVYEGADGLAAGMCPGMVAVEMSTVGPKTVERLAQQIEEVQCTLVDAPVSGSVAMAEAAQLTIMAGGQPQDIERVEPILALLGSHVFHVGPLGTGAAMKLAVNTIIYGLNQALSEGLILAERAGIDRLMAYKIFACSAIAAPFVHYRREAFERPGEVPVALRLSLAEKDLHLILELAQQLQTPLPQAMSNVAVLEKASSQGFEDHDVSGVSEYLRAQVPAVAERREQP